MIIYNFLQKSPEWFSVRAGVMTASEFGEIVKLDFTIRDGDGIRTYVARKVAEKWLGGPLPQSFTSFEQEQGNILEDEAIPHYELFNDCTIQRVGFVTTDDGKCGCSPDGLLGFDQLPMQDKYPLECKDGEGGIEIKCPNIETHVKYLLRGELPKDYGPQVHGAMLVTGAKRWKFMSYRRNFPAFVIPVERDGHIQDKLRAALATCQAMIDSAFEKLVELNGGKAHAI